MRVEIFGLPLHPLVVHGAVVLVPLALIGAITISFWPAARRQYGKLTLVIAVIAAGFAGVARLSGDALLQTKPAVSPVLEGHESWGEAVIYPAIAVIIGVGLILLAEWLRAKDPETGTAGYTNPRARLAVLLGGAVNVIAAATGLVLITLAGHSGATSVWG